jgi:lipopolysaccharide transport system permease protein
MEWGRVSMAELFPNDGMVRVITQHRYLLGQLIKRDVLLRYRGAYFGLLWIFLNPLIMLGIFTFVFGNIFQPRWVVDTGNVPYALNLYCGLIAFNIFSETVGRAPTMVRSNPNYVKKIIFPLQILPVVPLGAALIHAFFNVVILVLALFWIGNVNISLLLIPLLLFPLVMVGMGLAWFLASWGVFIKDMSQIVPVAIQMLMFLSPVFYPAQAVPEGLRSILSLNPLSPVIEAMRSTISGSSVDWYSWSIALVIGSVFLILGYVFFNRSREEFADAL